MPLQDLLPYLEDEIQDADQETFLLYSRPLPSQNLGFIDPKAQSVEVVLAGRHVTIYQSPAVLGSTRAGGTTGAVLWKVSPPFAEWLSSPGNPLSRAMLTPSSAVLELGCGISSLNALAAAPRVAHYVLSDQRYVRNLVSRNLVENQNQNKPCARQRTGKTGTGTGSIAFRALDWEQDEVTPGLAAPARWFDAVIATDCVYNYALVDPFVRTCVDACLLSVRGERRGGDGDGAGACVCVIAQQLRDHDVFRAWLGAFLERFRVWRVKGEVLAVEGLTARDGFVVHVGVLREQS